jgi:4-aminobutyrate aminotransferase/(S)-3-amino-2-methylpropionate transaminase
MAINRPALGVMPPLDWTKLIEQSVGHVKPKGLEQIFTAMCGSCANEIAFKVKLVTNFRLQV